MNHMYHGTRALAAARQPVYRPRTLSNLGTLQTLHGTEGLIPFPSTVRELRASERVPVEAIILFVDKSRLTSASLGFVSSAQHCIRIS
jgi:hypothetical protein